MKNLSIILFLSFFCSCKYGYTGKEEVLSKSFTYIRSIAHKLLEDTLKKLSLNPYEENIVRRMVLDSSFYNIAEIGKFIRYGALLKTHLLNDKILVEVNHRCCFRKTDLKRISTRTQELILFEKGKMEILSNFRLWGCHYHNFTISITDWDHDGDEEIKASIAWPMQSVRHITHSFTIIDFDIPTQELEQRAFICLDRKDCMPARNTTRGIQELTDYKLIYQKEIRLETKYYSFDCDNFEFPEDIQNKVLDSARYTAMYWNKEKRRYE